MGPRGLARSHGRVGTHPRGGRLARVRCRCRRCSQQQRDQDPCCGEPAAAPDRVGICAPPRERAGRRRCGQGRQAPPPSRRRARLCRIVVPPRPPRGAWWRPRAPAPRRAPRHVDRRRRLWAPVARRDDRLRRNAQAPLGRRRGRPGCAPPRARESPHLPPADALSYAHTRRPAAAGPPRPPPARRRPRRAPARHRG